MAADLASTPDASMSQPPPDYTVGVMDVLTGPPSGPNTQPTRPPVVNAVLALLESAPVRQSDGYFDPIGVQGWRERLEIEVGKLSRFAFKNPETAGLSDLLTESEQRLANYDEDLVTDRLKRENEVRRAAAEREEAKKQLEEKEAAILAEERTNRALYEQLAKQYGVSSGLVIHAMPCDGCNRSGDTCEGPEGKACSVCSEKHAPCSLSSSKRPRARAVTKKTPTTRIKKEPVSPPKKGGKRAFSEALVLSDNNPESDDDRRSNRSVSGSSTRLIPFVEIPVVRRSTRPARQQSTGSSKKVRINPPGDEDTSAVLKAQFDIVAEAFRTMGDALGKLRGE